MRCSPPRDERDVKFFRVYDRLSLFARWLILFLLGLFTRRNGLVKKTRIGSGVVGYRRVCWPDRERRSWFPKGRHLAIARFVL